MPVHVRIELMLPEWWGADDAFEAGGDQAVREMVMNDPIAMLDEAKWEIVQYVPEKK